MGKILFIVEGENDEVKFINRLFSICQDLKNYEIFSYKTNLHNLANLIAKNGEITDDFDIQLFLKSIEKDSDKKEILSQNFSDIILVFDFEPQQDVPHFDLIRKLALYFNESTENGKIYINYPMMQSYRHFNKLPNKEFKDVIITKEDAKNYKEIVGNISNYTCVEHHSYALFVSLAYHHLLKLHYILNGKFELPPKDFIYNAKQVDLFDKQLSLLNSNGWIYVINTFMLYLVEYNPTTFYNQVTTHKSKYNL